jgi:transposase
MDSGPLVAIYSRMYQEALFIPKPWYIEDIQIESHDKKQIILLNFEKGSLFPCPKCGQSHCEIHDTHPTRKRHLDFHGFYSCIHARVPRIKCPRCGVVTIDVPWGRKHSGFTYEYELMILSLASSMPILKVCEHINENFDRIFRIISYFVTLAIDTANYSQITTIAVDETSCKKGHKYITIVIDLEKRRVIFATPGKDHITINKFKEFLEQHEGFVGNIQDGCCDMSPAFIKGLKENFPNIKITFDKFHVMKMMNETLNKVRRNEQKENSVLIKSHKFWLKNRENLSDEDKEKLDGLMKMNLKTTRVYRFKLDLQEFWKMTDFEAANRYLKRLFWRATHSRIKELRDFGWTIKRHWEGILNIAGSKISNGILEALNGSVQTLKRQARGYRNTDNFITMIYLRLGKLNLLETAGLRQLSKTFG